MKIELMLALAFAYPPPFKFTGEIEKVVIDVK